MGVMLDTFGCEHPSVRNLATAMSRPIQLRCNLCADAAKAPPAPQMFGNAGVEHMKKYGTKCALGSVVVTPCRAESYYRSGCCCWRPAVLLAFFCGLRFAVFESSVNERVF
jgi:hypothetical protein